MQYKYVAGIKVPSVKLLKWFFYISIPALFLFCMIWFFNDTFGWFSR